MHSFEGGQWRDVNFPEPVYLASLSDTPEFTSKVFRYRYESFVTPTSVYDHDVTTSQSKLLLLKTKMKPAGHGGASGRYDALKDRSFEVAWMLRQVGITK